MTVVLLKKGWLVTDTLSLWGDLRIYRDMGNWMRVAVQSTRSEQCVSRIAIEDSVAVRAAVQRIDVDRQRAKKENSNAEFRPMGVPDNATPEERGREILRMVVELVKRGDLQDTAFVSRLLNIPLNNEKGISLSLSRSEQIPHRIAQGIQYSPNFEFSMQEPVIFIDLLKERTCVLLDDLLATFHREFDVGTEIVPDIIQGRPVDIPPEKGWSRLTQVLDATPGYLYISTNLNNYMRVDANGSSYEKCFPRIELKDSRRLQQLRREKKNG